MLDHAVEGEQDTSAGGGVGEWVGWGLQVLKMEMQVKTSGKGTGAETNGQKDSKLRDECCTENPWKSKPGGDKGMRWNQQLGGRGGTGRGGMLWFFWGWRRGEGRRGEGRVVVECTRQMTNCD